jgi:hypothetical protein
VTNSTHKHNILIISFSPIARDPRVMRQADLLSSSYSVTIAGFGNHPGNRFHFIKVPDPEVRPTTRKRLLQRLNLLFGVHDRYYWNTSSVRLAMEALRDLRPDAVIAHDIEALPIALRIAGNKPVVLDAHEYAPAEYSGLRWRLYCSRYKNYLCRQYMPKASIVTTVCDSIAKAYEAQFKVRPQVLRNIPEEQNLAPTKLQNGKIRMIHHGIASRLRQPEEMLRMMSFVDERFSLDLMLIDNDPAHLSLLKKMAAHKNNIRFIPPVPMSQICSHINNYDIGVFLLPPVNVNYHFALPNKFFEFIQARLALAVGPSPEMAPILQKYGCGIVAKSFEPAELGRKLRRLSDEEVQSMKNASHAAAKDLCYEKESEGFLKNLRQVMG